MGTETHIGLGALYHKLIVGVTLAGYDATPDNATKLVAVARMLDLETDPLVESADSEG